MNAQRSSDGTIPSQEARIEPVLRLVFAPVHKAAFGIALGTAGALVMSYLTLMVLLTQRAHDFPLGLLGEYFYGYTVSWPGLCIGAAWGFAVAFVFGWFMAFSRNVVLAATAFLIQTRAEVNEARDFLDHI